MLPNRRNKLFLPVMIVMLSTALVGCGILQWFLPDDPTGNERALIELTDPFFANCEACSASDFAGSKGIGNNNCHCCERKNYTTNERDSLFSFSSNNDTGSAKISIKGFLKGALGIGADAVVSFAVVETRRDVAIHKQMEDHCNKHTNSSQGDCDPTFLKEKRKLSAVIASDQGFNLSTEFALTVIKKKLDAEGGFSTVNGRREFRVKDFYLCSIAEHEPCNNTESSIPSVFTEDTTICR
jgi:hypothetical protein